MKMIIHMTTKFEDTIKSLKELQNYAESCNKDTIEKTSSISSIIERSFMEKGNL